MNVLQIGADRSGRGILVANSPAFLRQKAYAEKIGNLTIVGFSLQSDPFEETKDGPLHVIPTRSVTKYLFGLSALLIAAQLPRPDVISAQDPFETGIVAFLLSIYFRTPLHVQLHTDFLSPEYARMSVINRIRVVLAAFVLRRAARVRVVSERLKSSIEKAYALKAPITVLPIYVDIKKIRDSVPPPALVEKFSRFSQALLYVGRLEREKHPCLALRAFAHAAPTDACLIIVGTGSELDYLRKLAAELQIQERVFFEGEQESAPYYKLANLVLVTSRYEGYGLVIIEALAAGKPVLATDVGVAKEAGAIVAHESDYAHALKTWLTTGPFTASLAPYPYTDFADYVSKYVEDIASAAKH